ncbi:androgen-dependent TFPI-regulating protein-like [Trichoplusia ni]|uniref:Androgen-dependent TFPI-regulating protein-like n=1 Tax=Trichoplusia ni TaxID=7111 RepID=A0A7E5VY67_TRINI|nr:androgen-dependent TFPI-regulating protein-like [Trichoplusia ni]
MLGLDAVSLSTGFMKESKTLLKVRLWFYAFSYIHLVTVATTLLTIDFGAYNDPDIQMYQKIRFKLITAWFNLFTLVYFPICFYCDWRELRGQHERNHVKLLNHVRYLCFTSILLPTTAFGDILFWRVWNTHQELIAPPSIHKVVPFWSQHCMHTVSLVIILLDLVMVRRERPKNNMINVGILTTFLVVYSIVCILSFLQGEIIYPGLKLFTGLKFPVLITYVFVENFFYYTSQ